MLWFAKLMVRFFMSLDTTLFNFIGNLYDLLIAISRTSILTQGDIAQFATRIEILLGIFMLFKVSFSLITYIVNPDDFSDKSKGFGKLVQNSVISLLLIVLIPYIFQMAFSLQAKILDDNILAKLLLGEKISDSGDSSGNATILDTAGNTMAFYVMLPFFSPNYSVKDLNDCIIMVDSSGFNQECKDALEDAGLKTPNLENYTYGIENKSIGLTFRSETAISTVEDENDSSYEKFIIDYKYPLSTVTAVVVCLLLISFCIDIGVRSVKLAFLQLIYPIPAISYMDPKSGKDGIFSKWYKMCLSTFLSLFIRLLALYFGIYIITKVADFGMNDIVNGSQVTNGWVKIFVIIGVLMFVKQLPKILENMGIKLEGDGKFNLNPLKKIEEGAIGGKVLKKPNEMLGKMGKGALLAAPRGIKTFGKKMIGGIDAARHGKGFKQGWQRTHGKLYNDINKKIDEWAPERAEERKEAAQAKGAIAHMDRKNKLGEKYYKAVQEAKRRGKADASVADLFKNGQYRESFNAVDKAKQEMYTAKNNAQLVASRLGDVKKEADLSETDSVKFAKYGEKIRKERVELEKQINSYSGSTDSAEFKALEEQDEKLRDRESKLLDEFVHDQISEANAAAGKAESIYNMTKDKHDQYKKVYVDDARIEDAYDFYEKLTNNR